MILSLNDAVADYIPSSSKDAWTVTDLFTDTPLRAIKKVGVIGAGTMGGGSSMSCASAGIAVTLL